MAASALMCSKRTASFLSFRLAVFTSTSIRPYEVFACSTKRSTESLIGDVELMSRGGAARSHDLGHCRLGFRL